MLILYIQAHKNLLNLFKMKKKGNRMLFTADFIQTYTFGYQIVTCTKLHMDVWMGIND